MKQRTDEMSKRSSRVPMGPLTTAHRDLQKSDEAGMG